MRDLASSVAVLQGYVLGWGYEMGNVSVMMKS